MMRLAVIFTFSMGLGLMACDTAGSGMDAGLPDMAPLGAYDVCTAHCDALLRCIYLTAIMATNCRTDCSNNKGTYGDQDVELGRMCKNSAAIRQAQAACYQNASCQTNQVSFALTTSDCVYAAANTMCIKP